MDIGQIGSSAPMSARDPGLWKAAQSLEATFLAEMLKGAGLGQAREDFGGGAGEAQFSSMLVDRYAEALSDGGGIGLAEAIYRSLARGAEAP